MELVRHNVIEADIRIGILILDVEGKGVIEVAPSTLLNS